MSPWWMALSLYASMSADAPVQSAPMAAQRYVDPTQPQLQPLQRALPAPAAEVRHRADGEIEVRISGLRMEARATVDADGALLIQCGDPRHPPGPHAHVPESPQ